MRRPAATMIVLGSVLTSLPALAQSIEVPGSSIKFAAEIVYTINEQPVPLRCTGVGVRERSVMKVNAYAIASYILTERNLGSAEELVAADIPKVLHIKVERKFKGKKIADAFEKAILANYPREKFATELQGFTNFFLRTSVVKNDDVWLVHIPGEGLRCNMLGDSEMQIRNLDFSRAVWEMYFGAHPISEDLKRDLISRL